jgi:hypothetical protein
MANDEQPAHAEQGQPQPESRCASWPVCTTTLAWRVQRVVQRHRDDRRLAAPPTDGWQKLGAIQTADLSWPATRLN